LTFPIENDVFPVFEASLSLRWPPRLVIFLIEMGTKGRRGGKTEA